MGHGHARLYSTVERDSIFDGDSILAPDLYGDA